MIAGLIFFMIRNRRRAASEAEEEMAEETPEKPAPPRIPDVNEEQETDASARRKQLEKMAKEKPDEFAKLLRSWLSEE